MWFCGWELFALKSLKTADKRKNRYASVWPFLYFDPPTLLRPLYFGQNCTSTYASCPIRNPDLTCHDKSYRGRSKRVVMVEVHKRSIWCVTQKTAGFAFCGSTQNHTPIPVDNWLKFSFSNSSIRFGINLAGRPGSAMISSFHKSVLSNGSA